MMACRVRETLLPPTSAVTWMRHCVAASATALKSVPEFGPALIVIVRPEAMPMVLRSVMLSLRPAALQGLPATNRRMARSMPVSATNSASMLAAFAWLAWMSDPD
jgi:hypothetical protein